jgi:NADH:ubiquinone oxidoreductase subunit 6 (subunit J)
MQTFISILLGLVLLGVLGVLAAGVIGMVREGDPRRSNKMMQWRVALQALAILLFAAIMMLLRH